MDLHNVLTFALFSVFNILHFLLVQVKTKCIEKIPNSYRSLIELLAPNSRFPGFLGRFSKQYFISK